MNPCRLDIMYIQNALHIPNTYYYRLTDESVFKIGFSPEENLESLSNMSAGASASSHQ